MPSSQTLHPRNSHQRLNKPPIQTRERLPVDESIKPRQNGFHSSANIESRSSNTTCDTTAEDSVVMGPREVSNPSNFNLSYYMESGPDSSEPKGYEESYKALNCALQSKRKMMTDDTKYKTEMCKKWSETGQCPYGRKCKFAHGRHELNEKLLVNRSAYKSKKCAPFHTHLICPYGIRCMFAHEQRSVEELLITCEYRKFVSCPELLGSPSMCNKKRLPVFSSLVPEGSAGFNQSQDEIFKPRNLWKEMNLQGVDGQPKSFASTF